VQMQTEKFGVFVMLFESETNSMTDPVVLQGSNALEKAKSLSRFPATALRIATSLAKDWSEACGCGAEFQTRVEVGIV
jgi:hypothetical protein